MSTLSKPYEAQLFEARETPAAGGDALLRAEIDMDRLQKQLQAVKVDKANLLEKVFIFILHFLISSPFSTSRSHTRTMGFCDL